MKKMNVLFVFADQWRSQAFGYSGNLDVKTPHIDEFAQRSINVPNAISTCPVCSPYRASLLTGTYPLNNGVFTNDVMLNPSLPGLGNVYKESGYQTAYIGKWHVHGNGRSAYIPPEHRFGFDYWKVLECTHSYFNSKYYANDDKDPSTWEGYDADAQTNDLIDFLENTKDPQKPFFAVLSWGPPHAPPPFEHLSPYDQFPTDLKELYNPNSLEIRQNVPKEILDSTRKLLAGYYTHCTALDRNFGKILDCLNRSGHMEDTIIIFTSDHGDMIGSQGIYKKQSPFIEAINVPFLVHIPRVAPQIKEELVIGPEDIMPTLLSLCGIDIPETVDGVDCSEMLIGNRIEMKKEELFALYVACGQWRKDEDGGVHDITGREYRGIKTARYTYARDRNQPWLLFDEKQDPFQQKNLIGNDDYRNILGNLDEKLNKILKARGDTFEEGNTYNSQWGYIVDEDHSVIWQE